MWCYVQGLKKTDHQSILDDFNKHGRGIMQPVPLVAPPATPAISPAMTASSAIGFISSGSLLLLKLPKIARMELSGSY